MAETESNIGQNNLAIYGIVYCRTFSITVDFNVNTMPYYLIIGNLLILRRRRKKPKIVPIKRQVHIVPYFGRIINHLN